MVEAPPHDIKATLFWLSAQVIVAHSAAAVVTEAIFRMEGFVFGWWFVTVHFLLFALFSLCQLALLEGWDGVLLMLDLQHNQPTTFHAKFFGAITVPPLMGYAITGCAVAVSHGCGAVAMVHLNYTTATLFKSAKVPTTLIGGYLAGQERTGKEFLLALGMSTGLVLFGIAEKYVAPKFAVTGLVLISINLIISSFSSNFQQMVLQSQGTNDCGSRLSISRLMFYQYSIAFVLTFAWCLVSGEFSAALAWYTANGWHLILMNVTDSACTFAGLNAIYQISALFDATRANVVCASRKQLTFVVSYALFSKPFYSLHAVGLVLTLGCGLLLQKSATGSSKRAAPSEAGSQDACAAGKDQNPTVTL